MQLISHDFIEFAGARDAILAGEISVFSFVMKCIFAPNKNGYRRAENCIKFVCCTSPHVISLFSLFQLHSLYAACVLMPRKWLIFINSDALHTINPSSISFMFFFSFFVRHQKKNSQKESFTTLVSLCQATKHASRILMAASSVRRVKRKGSFFLVNDVRAQVPNQFQFSVIDVTNNAPSSSCVEIFSCKIIFVALYV
jgi:hypothetical protein